MTDEYNNTFLLTKIQNHIDSANIFICDITPDYIINKTHNQIQNDNINYDISVNELTQYYDNLYPVINSNVSLELGYAISNMEHNNIILIRNKTITNKTKLQSLLNGFYIVDYEILHEESNINISDNIFWEH
jgi:hypothetical protein